MPPGRGGHRGAVEPEGRIDRIERILEGLVQVVQDNHNDNNAETSEEQAVQVPREKVMARTTIKQFQRLRPPTFLRTPDPMATKSWFWRIKRVLEILLCINEQKVVLPPLPLQEPP